MSLTVHSAEISSPLVTVMIVTRNRLGCLKETLRSLEEQDYPNREILLFDDSSTDGTVEWIKDHYPHVRLLRSSEHVGYIVGRNRMMQVAGGEFLLNLDDDSNFTRPDDIRRAVRRMQQDPKIAALAFRIHHGLDEPEIGEVDSERQAATFIGCGHALRRSALAQIGLYQERFFFYCEELEWSMRALRAGLHIVYFPEVVVHHRVDYNKRAEVGRIRSAGPGEVSSQYRWGYSVRNQLLTVLLHEPILRCIKRLVRKLAWNLYVAWREGFWSAYFWAVGSFLFNAGWALRHRQPLSRSQALQWDALFYQDRQGRL